MSRDVLAFPVLVTWGLIDLTARLAVRVHGPAGRPVLPAPIAVPAPRRTATTAPVHLTAVAGRAARPVAAPPREALRSAS